jgi:hypothetical protein
MVLEFWFSICGDTDRGEESNRLGSFILYHYIHTKTKYQFINELLFNITIISSSFFR